MRACQRRAKTRIPHTRGGEPERRTDLGNARRVFPTRVGVNRTCAWSRLLARRIPHTRGGEPSNIWTRLAAMRYSPHAWG